jgi:uncharacterized protein
MKPPEFNIFLSKNPVDISGIKDIIGSSINIEYNDSLSELIKDIKFKDKANIKIKITNSGNNQMITTGIIETTVSLKCQRCLTDFDYKIKDRFKVKYLPINFYTPIDKSHSHKTEIEVSIEEIDNLFYSGNLIDILGLIREELILKFPIKPLCKEDCKGLCPLCGINLNKSSCNCKKEKDITLGEKIILKDLLIKKEE